MKKVTFNMSYKFMKVSFPEGSDIPIDVGSGEETVVFTERGLTVLEGVGCVHFYCDQLGVSIFISPLEGRIVDHTRHWSPPVVGSVEHDKLQLAALEAVLVHTDRGCDYTRLYLDEWGEEPSVVVSEFGEYQARNDQSSSAWLPVVRNLSHNLVTVSPVKHAALRSYIQYKSGLAFTVCLSDGDTVLLWARDNPGVIQAAVELICTGPYHSNVDIDTWTEAIKTLTSDLQTQLGWGVNGNYRNPCFKGPRGTEWSMRQDVDGTLRHITFNRMVEVCGGADGYGSGMISYGITVPLFDTTSSFTLLSRFMDS